MSLRALLMGLAFFLVLIGRGVRQGSGENAVMHALKRRPTVGGLHHRNPLPPPQDPRRIRMEP